MRWRHRAARCPSLAERGRGRRQGGRVPHRGGRGYGLAGARQPSAEAAAAAPVWAIGVTAGPGAGGGLAMCWEDGGCR